MYLDDASRVVGLATNNARSRETKENGNGRKEQLFFACRQPEFRDTGFPLTYLIRVQSNVEAGLLVNAPVG